MPSQSEWHHLEWDEDKVKRFWDFAAHWEGWHEDCFSRQVGKGIVNFLSHIVPLQGHVLDYGCGTGYLVEHLLAAGAVCKGVDLSAESVASANAKFDSSPLWKGAEVLKDDRLPFPDSTFDLVVSVETIEHILPSHAGTILRELRRILKPGRGRLFITTPNSENLAHAQVYCPGCGSVFHRYQHVTSFSAGSLSDLLETHGFNTCYCDVTDFGLFQRRLLPNPLDLSPRRLGELIGQCMAVSLDALRLPVAPYGGYRFNRLVGGGPHLFWVGSRA